MSLLKLDSYGTASAPQPDPRSLTVGQVHLGLGAFHRAHQAIYTEDAIRQTGEHQWGIAAFTQRSGAAAARLAPQDGLYTVVVNAAWGRLLRASSGRCARSAMHPQTRPRWSTGISDPGAHVVTLTVTEKGYRHNPVTGQLHRDDPYVLADLGSRTPRTVPGVLAHAIARRAATGAGPLTVISCDNLPDKAACWSDSFTTSPTPPAFPPSTTPPCRFL